MNVTNNNKTEMLKIRISPEDKAALVAAAGALGLSEWVRKVAMACVVSYPLPIDPNWLTGTPPASCDYDAESLAKLRRIWKEEGIVGISDAILKEIEKKRKLFQISSFLKTALIVLN